jgi:hypothetical protein
LRLSCTSILTCDGFRPNIETPTPASAKQTRRSGTGQPIAFPTLDWGAAQAACQWKPIQKGAKQMFESFEELTRFGESARKVLFKSIARWTAASAIAALWIQTFLYAFLPTE